MVKKKHVTSTVSKQRQPQMHASAKKVSQSLSHVFSGPMVNSFHNSSMEASESNAKLVNIKMLQFTIGTN